MNYELIAKALFANYENIYDIEVETSAFSSFHQSEEYSQLEIEPEGDDFFESVYRNCNLVIVPEDREYVIRNLSKESLLKELIENKRYSFVYRVMRGEEEVYHEISAVLQDTPDGEHIYLGVKNVDEVIRKNIAHRDELRSMRQKENNHLEAVLASSAAYMEVNLTKDLILERSDDYKEPEKRFIKRYPNSFTNPSYSGFHEWLCQEMIRDNVEQYREIGSREYLLERYQKGDLRASVHFSVPSEKGTLRPCREVFFLYEESATKDIHGFCVIYNLTERQREEQEREELKRELELSRVRNFTSQMQPHFLYNALGSIQEVILINPEYASDLLGDFTVHLKSCVRAMTKDEPLSFLQEVDNVNAYVNIEKLRLGDKLKVFFDLAATDFKILPLTVQPIVENAIRHGIYKRGLAGGNLFIQSREEEDCFVITVKDDGVGFDVEEYEARKGVESNGIRNIKFRLEKVMNARLEVRSQLGKGTTVNIYIPKGGENARDNS